jgi:hypothetical protein
MHEFGGMIFSYSKTKIEMYNSFVILLVTMVSPMFLRHASYGGDKPVERSFQ